MIRKGQITIFILMAVMVVVLFVFLISSNVEVKEGETKEAKESIQKETSGLSASLQSQITYCLENEVSKALLVAGFKGGFIYEKEGEIYMSNIGFSNQKVDNNPGEYFGYSTDFLKDIDINSENLGSGVLIHSKELIHTPKIYEPVIFPQLTFDEETGEIVAVKEGSEIVYDTIYSHSVKEDVYNFIVSNYFDCLNLNNFKKEGFEIEFQNYSGIIGNFEHKPSGFTYNLAGINPITFSHPNGGTLAEVKGLYGKEVTKYTSKENLDKVLVVIEGRNYSGVILKPANTPIESAQVFFEALNLENLVLNSEILSYPVVNLDSSFLIQVDFNDEEIIAKANVPLVLRKNNLEISAVEAETKFSVRLIQLLAISEKILSLKEEDRSYDVENEFDTFKEIYSTLAGPSGFNDIDITKYAIKDDPEEKEYVYSIFDRRGRLYGESYVFNFGYENQAPYFDIRNLEYRYKENGEETVYGTSPVVMITSSETTVNDNLNRFFQDYQLMDNRPGKTHFIPDSQINNRASFVLESNGDYEFTAFEEDTYSYIIKVTDGEAIREQEIIIVAGVPNNEDNEDLDECIDYMPAGNNYFPIDSKFSSGSLLIDESGSTPVGVGYYITQSSLADQEIKITEPIQLEFNSICRPETDSGLEYELKVNGNLNSIYGVNPDSGEIGRISNGYKLYPYEESQILNFELSIKDGDNYITQDPYKFTLYPAKCLGPEFAFKIDSDQVWNPETNEVTGNGLDITIPSCCDMTWASDLGDPAFSGPYPRPPGNELKDNFREKYEVYMCAETESFDPFLSRFTIGSSSYPRTVENTNIWSHIDEDITGKFKAELTYACKGEVPIFLSNIESIGPTSDSPTFGSKSFKSARVSEVVAEESDPEVFKYYSSWLKSIDFTDRFTMSLVDDGSLCEFCELDSAFTIIGEKRAIKDLTGDNIITDADLVPWVIGVSFAPETGVSTQDPASIGPIPPTDQLDSNAAFHTEEFKYLCGDYWQGWSTRYVWIHGPDYDIDSFSRSVPPPNYNYDDPASFYVAYSTPTGTYSMSENAWSGFSQGPPGNYINMQPFSMLTKSKKGAYYQETAQTKISAGKAYCHQQGSSAVCGPRGFSGGTPIVNGETISEILGNPPYEYSNDRCNYVRFKGNTENIYDDFGNLEIIEVDVYYNYPNYDPIEVLHAYPSGENTIVSRSCTSPVGNGGSITNNDPTYDPENVVCRVIADYCNCPSNEDFPCTISINQPEPVYEYADEHVSTDPRVCPGDNYGQTEILDEEDQDEDGDTTEVIGYETDYNTCLVPWEYTHHYSYTCTTCNKYTDDGGIKCSDSGVNGNSDHPACS